MSSTKTFITAYDYLKIIAVVMMIIDHVGAYLYPDEMMLRVIGRLCVPIWLFLIGYARSRTIDKVLIASALILTITDTFVTHSFHPLNILFAIILIRLTLTPIMRWIGNSENKLILVTAICFILTPVTRPYIDYGTMAFALAMAGYLVRNGFNAHDKHAALAPPLFTAITIVLYCITQILNFDFSIVQHAVLWLGSVGIFYLLAIYFPPRSTGTLPVTAPNSPALRGMISFIGHHTLVIYVIHLLILYGILYWSCLYQGPFPCFPS